MRFVIYILLLFLFSLSQYIPQAMANPLEIPLIGRGYDATTGEVYTGSGLWSGIEDINKADINSKVTSVEKFVKDVKTYEESIGSSIWLEAKKGLFKGKASAVSQNIMNKHNHSVYFFAGGRRTQKYVLNQGTNGYMEIFSENTKTIRNEIWDAWLSGSAENLKKVDKLYTYLLKNLGPSIVVRVETTCNIARTFEFESSTKTEQEQLYVSLKASYSGIRGEAIHDAFRKEGESHISYKLDSFMDTYKMSDPASSISFDTIIHKQNQTIDVLSRAVANGLKGVDMSYAPVTSYGLEPLWRVLALPEEVSLIDPGYENLFDTRNRKIMNLYTDYLNLEASTEKLNAALNIVKTESNRTKINELIGDVRSMQEKVTECGKKLYLQKSKENKTGFQEKNTY